MLAPILTLSCLVLTAGAQFHPKNAKILKEQRFNAGDGRFGSAYAQEDGTISREEVSADGERVGQYSYIDTEGQTITVRYTAGKDGFRILEGAHVPTGADGLNSAAYDPEIALQGSLSEETREPPSVANPRPRAPPRVANPRPAPQREEPRAQGNPFINPADPTHRDFRFNANAAQFQPQQPARQAAQPRQRRPQQQQQQQFQFQQQFQQQQQQQFQPQQQQRQPEPFVSADFASSVPPCAGCEGLNPFINPADPSHAALFPNHQFKPQQQQQQFQPQPQQQQQRFQPQPQQFQPQPQPQQPTFRQPAQPSFQAVRPSSTFPIQQQEQQEFFRFPSQQQQQQQQPIQPAFLQQPQQRQQRQQQFQQLRFQQQQQQQLFRQQPTAEELAHQRLGESQIQEAVNLQNCLVSGDSSC